MSGLNLDIESIIAEFPRTDPGGVYRLWLAVTLDAISTLKAGDFRHAWNARLFLFGQDNPFFEAVCDGLDISPEAIRGRIRKMGLIDDEIVTPERGR